MTNAVHQARPDPVLPAPPRQDMLAKVHEEVLALTCEATALWGIVSLPSAQAQPQSAVVVVVGGPQYRVGSHRQFVQLARRLAAEGHAVLRFDVRGMGDSAGLALPDFTNLSADISAAVAGLLQRLPSLQRIALWGLCDGASAALMYMQHNPDPRVVALCLANPWVRSVATQAQATVKHYYKDRLRQRSFWLKLLKGGVAAKAVRDLFSNLQQARGRASSAAKPDAADGRRHEKQPFQSRMAQGWRDFSGPILLLLSENDYTAKEFIEATRLGAEWAGAMSRKDLTRIDLAGTDHTCSDRAGRLQLEDATAKWLAQHLLSGAAHSANS